MIIIMRMETHKETTMQTPQQYLSHALEHYPMEDPGIMYSTTMTWASAILFHAPINEAEEAAHYNVFMNTNDDDIGIRLNAMHSVIAHLHEELPAELDKQSSMQLTGN